MGIPLLCWRASLYSHGDNGQPCCLLSDWLSIWQLQFKSTLQQRICVAFSGALFSAKDSVTYWSFSLLTRGLLLPHNNVCRYRKSNCSINPVLWSVEIHQLQSAMMGGKLRSSFVHLYRQYEGCYSKFFDGNANSRSPGPRKRRQLSRMVWLVFMNQILTGIAAHMRYQKQEGLSPDSCL